MGILAFSRISVDVLPLFDQYLKKFGHVHFEFFVKWASHHFQVGISMGLLECFHQTFPKKIDEFQELQVYFCWYKIDQNILITDIFLQMVKRKLTLPLFLSRFTLTKKLTNLVTFLL